MDEIALGVVRRVGGCRPLRNTTELLDSIRIAQARFISEGDPKPAFESLLQTLVRMTRSEFGFLDEVLRDDGVLTRHRLALSNVAWDERSRKFHKDVEAGNLKCGTPDNLAGAPAVTGELIIANDARRHPRFRGLPPGHPPIDSFMGIPLFFGGELVGVAGVANRPGGYDRSIADVLEPFATTCAGIIRAVRSRRKEKQIAEELRHSEAVLNEAQEIARIGSFVWDLRDDSLTCSANVYALAGLPPDSSGNDFREWITKQIPLENRPEASSRSGRMPIRPKMWPMEFQVVKPGGDVRTWRSRSRLLFDEMGAPIKCIGVCYDITEERLAEERAREAERRRAKAEKLAATGRIAAEIAHEINNPLAGIDNYLELLRGAVPEEHPDRKYLDGAQREIDRIARIVAAMLDLQRPIREGDQRVDVAGIVRDVIAMLSPQCSARGVKITNSIEGPIFLGSCGDSLRQILLNLIKNAVEASAEGGTVEVRATIAEDQVCLTVTDHGPGIDPEMERRIFEPFFSTKPAGKASGLGLAISQGIVQTLGGTIRLESKPGVATSFHVTLPRSVHKEQTREQQR